MCNIIVTSPRNSGKTQDEPGIVAYTPTQERNRRLFLKALAAGCHVQYGVGDTYIVTSTSRAGHVHHVTRTTNEDGEIVEYCNCEWGNKVGWISRNMGGLPCCHMLILRFHVMAEDAREALLDQDPELAAVAGRTETLAA